MWSLKIGAQERQWFKSFLDFFDYILLVILRNCLPVLEISDRIYSYIYLYIYFRFGLL